MRFLVIFTFLFLTGASQVSAAGASCGLSSQANRFQLNMSGGTVLSLRAIDLRELVANSDCTPLRQEVCPMQVTRKKVADIMPHCAPVPGSATEVDYVSLRMGSETGPEFLGTGDCYEVECQGFGEGLPRERFDNRFYCEQNPQATARAVLADFQAKGFCQ